MAGSLAGKVAVVTGASSGIGLATAELLATEGAKVIATDWNAKRLEDAVATLSAKRLTVRGVSGNVSEPADVDRMIDAAITGFGALHVLVNNAGIMDLDQPVGNLDLAVWKRVMSVNVDGPMLAMRAAMPDLLKSGGSIVNIASVAGVSGAAAGVAYTTSKHAVIGMTKNTAWMYAKRNVRCNAIAVGGVNTNIMESVDASKLDKEGLARASDYYPLMPTMLNPIDIANLVLFLASDSSRYINGAVISADAGWRAA
ncbi:MAG TPA: SDR family oxidoreductase [Bauldia sp.]|nr:SDR family oxidoreductase [Bauldia sp.]